MASRICWNCRTSAHHTIKSAPAKARGEDRWFAAMQCDSCGVLSVAFVRAAFRDSTSAQSWIVNPENALGWEPRIIEGEVYSDVPTHIAQAASEAHTCRSVGAFRGAIMLARAVVEATAKDKGITGGNLAVKIEKMLEAHMIRPLVKDTADEIRFMGNDMAHGDFVVPVDENDADDVLAFMAEVLNEVYQAPARMNARREERLARKASARN